MKSLNYLSLHKNTQKMQMLKTESGITKYRIVPEWEQDQNLQKV